MKGSFLQVYDLILRTLEVVVTLIVLIEVTKTPKSKE
jgi:hypothetical protein